MYVLSYKIRIIVKQFPVIFNNESIEFVKECCLLGFKISTDVLNRNIEATIQTFYRKCHEVRFDFSMLSSDIKSKLISTYCMDLCGSQLWNYGTGYPESCVEKSNTFNMEITISYTL